jgi:hypothetical protein
MLKKTYHRVVPELWKERIDLQLYGHSRTFRECYSQTGVLFIHIPKAAGISIANAIYGRSVGHYPASTFVSISHKHFEELFTFTFTRNPWDRLVSAYSFVRQNGTDLVKPLASDVYRSDVFSNFRSFVIDWLRHQDLLSLDCVFWPQAHYVCDGAGKVMLDHVGRLENIAMDIGPVEDRLGRAIELPRLNSSKRRPSYRDYYDDELADVVASIYSRDIKLFGYEYS